MNLQNSMPAGTMPRRAEERVFETRDGAEIRFRHWPVAGSAVRRGAVLLLHEGGRDYGGLAPLRDEGDLDGFDFYAWDGRADGAPDARDLPDLVRDFESFVRHLEGADGLAPEDIALVGQASAALIAATWVHDYAPRIRAMVLAAPALGGGLARGRLERETARRVVADAAAISVPTQVLAVRQRSAAERAGLRFFDGLASRTKERHVFEDDPRGLLKGASGTHARGEVSRFLRDRFQRPVEFPDLLDADLAGHTREERDRLASPLPPWSAAALRWRLVRGGIRAGALVSRGLAIGRETGFDSGASLDYVYRDEAEGAGPLGRLVDRVYLDSIGWRGIRARKLHVEELIGEAFARLKAEGQPLRVVDIAAGHGRYVLDGLAEGGRLPESVLLRDFDERNVAAGRRLIAERSLGQVVRFERGDAFDADDLARLDPRPTLAIVSGLYELFPENACVRRSLSGLARAVPPGGYLIYTGQPWHPQLEMIARALTSHRGGSWVMRRRTQAELDQLVTAAGFAKVGQRIDRWGIFTVSLARRLKD